MESFNGNTVRLREDVIRGLKKDDSAILAGLRVYHNLIRPHLGLKGHITPGEAAGITVEGALFQIWRLFQMAPRLET